MHAIAEVAFERHGKPVSRAANYSAHAEYNAEQVTAFRMGDVDCVIVTQGDRGWPEFGNGGQPWFAALLVRHGWVTVQQDGRYCQAGPGSFSCVDGSRPYGLEASADGELAVFRIPCEMLRQRVGRTEPYTAIAVDRKCADGLLMNAYLASIADVAANEGLADLHRFGVHTVDLLVATILARGSQRGERSLHREALLCRAKQAILNNISNPDVDAATIAVKMGITQRYMSSLFSDEKTTFSKFLLAARLERCIHMLSQPRRGSRMISEVAFACGFCNFSHFCKAFKARTGMTPSQYRAKFNLVLTENSLSTT